jgi:hypothetical protein
MVEEGDPRGERASDQDMVGRLKEKGVPPKDINDALNREKIKSAVSADVGDSSEGMQASIMRPEKPRSLPTEGGALSDEDLAPPPHEPRRGSDYTPKTQEISEERYVPKPQEEAYMPSQEYAPSQGYSIAQEYAPQEAYDEYAPGGGITDTDTMIEISEQVFSEKIKNIQKQVEAMNEFRALSETKIDHMSTRLKRIETAIDGLQAAILERVGAYGRGLEGIKKEMAMMQDSFGKMVKGVADKPRKKHHTIHRIKKETTVTHRSGKKHSRKK